MKHRIVKILIHLAERSYFLRFIAKKSIKTVNRIRGKCNVTMTNNGACFKIKKDILGLNNSIVIGKNSFLDKSFIRMHGDNNTMIFGENVKIGPGCSFWCEGNNLIIKIGDETTITENVHICAQEDNRSIIVGNDCMLSNSIIIRTSDSHPIYSSDGIRLNNPKNVIIGNHVWIAPHSTIMKGAIIEDGCIIGSNTMVNSCVEKNSLCVGTPSKIVRRNIYWTREKLF